MAGVKSPTSNDKYWVIPCHLLLGRSSSVRRACHHAHPSPRVPSRWCRRNSLPWRHVCRSYRLAVNKESVCIMSVPRKISRDSRSLDRLFCTWYSTYLALINGVTNIIKTEQKVVHSIGFRVKSQICHRVLNRPHEHSVSALFSSTIASEIWVMESWSDGFDFPITLYRKYGQVIFSLYRKYGAWGTELVRLHLFETGSILISIGRYIDPVWWDIKWNPSELTISWSGHFLTLTENSRKKHWFFIQTLYVMINLSFRWKYSWFFYLITWAPPYIGFEPTKTE